MKRPMKGVVTGHDAAGNAVIALEGPPEVMLRAVAWWMSAACCVDNLLHAAAMPATGLPASRVWQLPVLRLSVEEVLDALLRRHGAGRRGLVSFVPDESIEALFGRQPPLDAREAERAGFRNDGSAADLVERALERRNFA